MVIAWEKLNLLYFTGRGGYLVIPNGVAWSYLRGYLVILCEKLNLSYFMGRGGCVVIPKGLLCHT